MVSQSEISVEDLRVCGWKELLGSATSHDCSHYSGIFFAAGAHEHDSHRAPALVVLGHATTMVLKSGAENADQPLVAQAVIDGKRTAIPSDFTEAELKALSEFAPEITDPELQARIADLVWITTRHYPATQIAMPAYLQAAEILAKEGKWAAAINRLERCLRLATKLGKPSNSTYVAAMGYVNQLLSQSDLLDGKHFGPVERLMKLVLELGEGDSTLYSQLTNNLAINAEHAQDWFQARGYWTLNALWHNRLNDEAATKSARIRAAQSFERAADQALTGPSPNHGTAVAYLDDALQDMRRLGESAEAARLQARLLEQQALMTSELVRFSSEAPDVSEQIQAAQEAVKGMDFADAIVELAALALTMTEGEAVSAADDIAQEAPFLHSISAAAINEYGRTVAQRPSRYSDSADEVTEAVHADAVDYAANSFKLHNSVIAESARQQILLEHHVAPEDFLFLLRGNPFVERSRTNLIARGLQAGLLGDFPGALHLLIPQLEHSLRHVLAEMGMVTSSFVDPTGIQDEHNINALLYREELKSLFGDNLLFSLKVALVERWGYNFRNRLAHGLLDESDCYSDAARYVWSLTLHFYGLPALMRRRHPPEATTTTENSP